MSLVNEMVFKKIAELGVQHHSLRLKLGQDTVEFLPSLAKQRGPADLVDFYSIMGHLTFMPA